MYDFVADQDLPALDEEYANVVMPDALYHFGNFARGRCRYEIAEVCFRLVIRLKPDHTQAQTNLGTALGEAGKSYEAISELQKAIVLDPADAIAHAGLGVVYERTGVRAKALEHLSRAIELRGGEYPFAQQELEKVRSGRTLAQQGGRHAASAFLSYASEDREVARRLARDLNAAGIDVWLDEWSIVPGDSIAQKISEALRAKKFFLPIISRAFVSKPWPMRELHAAIMREASGGGGHIVPAVIDEIKLPDIIADICYADVRKDYDSGLRQLVRALTTTPFANEGKKER